MFRATVRSANTVAKRNFSTTKVRSVHYPEGPYHNLPFKVHNRKIPYAFLHFGFFREYYIQPAPQVSEMLAGFLAPFGIVYVHNKRARG
ncbi:hypothetical protein LXG23DRAFT_57668 [Yarrowia lipolytica]|nr:hypothetical protein LXG23DRAFT_57668 [Yarrowia lipolytica]